MPARLNGQRQETGVIGNMVTIAQIATGEAEETGYTQAAKVASRKAGAKSRQDNTTAEQRSDIGRKAANQRGE